MRENALELSGVSKNFGGVAALSEANLEIRAGEVHGLLGQNGSGKSTLIKILAGYHAPDSGTVAIRGERVNLPISSPQNLGIAIIHQDLGLVDSMTVLENIGISDAYGKRLLSNISWRSFRYEVEALLTRLGCEVRAEQLVRELRGSDRSMVAIARAMRILDRSGSKHIFILDEPTAYLGVTESERLLRTMRRVADEGSSVLFVSHKLNEVLAVTDRCTILRDGRTMSTVETADVTAHELVHLQLGRRMDDFYPPMAAPPAEEIGLDVAGLTVGPVEGVSFALRRGEIVGLTGLAGMGQDEVIEAVAGARMRSAGVVSHDGVLVADDIRNVLRANIVLVPEDRKGQGLWLDASGRENFMLPESARNPPLSSINRKDEKSRTLTALKQVRVRPLATETRVGALSGGNQQKVLMAKSMASGPAVLLLHEPTQGVDAAARREIIELINAAAEDGASVMVASTDYEQLARMCHRVLVLRDGSVSDELIQPLTEADVLLACQKGNSPSTKGAA